MYDPKALKQFALPSELLDRTLESFASGQNLFLNYRDSL
jgi:hypothetical protein